MGCPATVVAQGGLGGRRASAPDVVPGTAEGPWLSRQEIIRRIIRRHINKLFCYERELVRTPGLLGRVAIQFTIAGTDPGLLRWFSLRPEQWGPVEQCIAQAVRRWGSQTAKVAVSLW